MVHWPEVIVTYDTCDKVLFSADGFGKFGALDISEDWADEARRYYVGIVGKYGPQVQALLKKAAGLDISIICPLHGPVLTENLGYYINLYDIWSSYRVESEGIVVAYTSVYGHTKAAVELLAQKLREKGCPKVVVHDLARCDMAKAVEDAKAEAERIRADAERSAEEVRAKAAKAMDEAHAEAERTRKALHGELAAHDKAMTEREAAADKAVRDAKATVAKAYGLVKGVLDAFDEA